MATHTGRHGHPLNSQAHTLGCAPVHAVALTLQHVVRYSEPSVLDVEHSVGICGDWFTHDNSVSPCAAFAEARGAAAPAAPASPTVVGPSIEAAYLSGRHLASRLLASRACSLHGDRRKGAVAPVNGASAKSIASLTNASQAAPPLPGPYPVQALPPAPPKTNSVAAASSEVSYAAIVGAASGVMAHASASGLAVAPSFSNDPTCSCGPWSFMDGHRYYFQAVHTPPLGDVGDTDEVAASSVSSRGPQLFFGNQQRLARGESGHRNGKRNANRNGKGKQNGNMRIRAADPGERREGSGHMEAKPACGGNNIHNIQDKGSKAGGTSTTTTASRRGRRNRSRVQNAWN